MPLSVPIDDTDMAEQTRIRTERWGWRREGYRQWKLNLRLHSLYAIHCYTHIRQFTITLDLTQYWGIRHVYSAARGQQVVIHR